MASALVIAKTLGTVTALSGAAATSSVIIAPRGAAAPLAGDCAFTRPGGVVPSTTLNRTGEKPACWTA